MSDLPTLEVREYEERPGAFYLAVGLGGRWIVDDEAEARRVAAFYNAAREGQSAEMLRPLLAWAEAMSQHYAMLRTEPPFTSTRGLRAALEAAYRVARP